MQAGLDRAPFHNWEVKLNLLVLTCVIKLQISQGNVEMKLKGLNNRSHRHVSTEESLFKSSISG